MKKCLIMPDSFKGTLSAIEICDTIKEKVLEFYPDCEVSAIPIADGGEGTADCFIYALQAEKVSVTVKNAYGEAITAYYAKIGSQAIIEAAQAVGLPQAEGRGNPAITTTYGVGELILHAVLNGCSQITLGLGGSCTNDAGTGAACALGCIFSDDLGKKFVPTGETLHRVRKIDIKKAEETLKGCKITAMCDIDNTMYGLMGAAVIFSPQKGADAVMVKELDENLISLSETIKRELNRDVSKIPGGGAAGAFGAGVAAFFHGELKSGIDTVLDLIEFEKIAVHADMIFTGEGRMDSQSLGGKAISGIARRAQKMQIPVTAIVGAIGEGAEEGYQIGITAIFSINQQAEDFKTSRYKSRENLSATADSILRLYRTADREEA